MPHVVDAICEKSQPTVELRLHANEATNAATCCNSENVSLNEAVVIVQMMVVRPQRWVTSEYQSGVYSVRVHFGNEDVELLTVMLARPSLPRAERDTEPIGHGDDCASAILAERDVSNNTAHNLVEGNTKFVDAC